MHTAFVQTGSRSGVRTVRCASGFTLIELMVVVVILGMLAAIVVPRFMGATDTAKVQAAKTQIQSFKMSLDMYKLSFGNYPKTNEGLESLINNGKQNFLDQEVIPLDPWKNKYVYACPGSQGRPFEIVSYGEDGAPGGTELAADILSWNLQAES